MINGHAKTLAVNGNTAFGNTAYKSHKTVCSSCFLSFYLDNRLKKIL